MNAIITGGTKGIGRAIADKLALEGYNLSICSRKRCLHKSQSNSPQTL